MIEQIIRTSEYGNRKLLLELWILVKNISELDYEG